MTNKYNPPFTITEEITNLVIEIAELVGIIYMSKKLTSNPILRRENRIKTIYSSLAIEQNTLTLEQITDIGIRQNLLKKLRRFKHVQICPNGQQ